MTNHIFEDAQQQAALQLHIEIEEACKIKFDNFRFQIDEDNVTVLRYGEPEETFKTKRLIRLFYKTTDLNSRLLDLTLNECTGNILG